jgi:hypothetical protein
MGLISNTVRNQQGRVIVGASVTVYDEDGVVVDTATTDADGEYEVDLDMGAYRAVIKSGEDFDTVTVIVCDALPEGSTTSQTVLDANNLPIDAALVWIRDGDGDLVVVAGEANPRVTDRLGRWSSALPAGDYELTITKAGVVLDTIAYHVCDTDVNLPPTVNAGADQDVDDLVSLVGTVTGTANDPDAGPDALTYAWSKVSGPGTVTFDDATALSTEFTLSLPGTYVLRLTVTDGEATVSDDITIAANVSPVADAGDDDTIFGSGTLDGSGSDADAGPSSLTYAWSKVSGPGTVTFDDATDPQTGFSVSVAGTYVLRLTVSDGDASDTDDVTIESLSQGNFSSVSLNGTAFEMFVDGTLAYIVGQFTSVDDASGTYSRSRAACLDLTTGLWTSWNPDLNAICYRIIDGGAGALYLAGDFTVVGGHNTLGTVKVNKTTGAADTGFAVSASSAGRAIALSGSDLFIGANGGVRQGKYNAATGIHDATWVVSLNGGGEINDLAIVGANLYVTGSFSTCQGVARAKAAAVAISNAALAAWDPGISGGTNPLDLKKDATNSLLYPLGAFTTVGGVAHQGIAQIQTDLGGTVNAWTMGVAGGGASMSGFCTDGTDVWAGGDFTTINGQARTRLAKVDRVTGAIAAWAPTLNAAPQDLGIGINNTVVAIGAFTEATGGAVRQRIAVFDATSGALL